MDDGYLEPVEDDDELYANLTCCGWLMVENIERMISLGYNLDEICEVLDLPSPSHLLYILAKGHEERNQLLDGIDGLS